MVVIYAVGSPLVADLEEGLERAGTSVAAAVANVPGAVEIHDKSKLIRAGEVTPELEALPYLVPLFTPANRHRAAAEAAQRGFRHPHVFVDPTAVVPRSLQAGPGTWINAGVTIGAATMLEPFVLINRGASVGHHARIGAFGSVGPGATLAGQVTMGAAGTVGAGAVVLPKVTIGAHSVVAAGSVVTRAVPEAVLVMGNPARVVREGLPRFDPSEPRLSAPRAEPTPQ